MSLTKTDRAEQGITKWVANKGIGTLHWVMQFGKTRAGCLIAARTFAVRREPIFIVVPSQIVKKQWNDTLQEFTSLLDYPNEVCVFTINELNLRLHKDRFKVNLLILDEIHKYTSKEASKVFTHIEYKFLLGLTGTYPTGIEGKMLNKYCPVVDTITEREALDNGWIAPYREYNILLELPDEDKKRYEQFSKPISEILQLFRGSYKEFEIGNTKQYLFDSDYSVIQSCYSGKSTKDIYGNTRYFNADDIRRTLAMKKGWHQQLDLSFDLSNQIDLYWNPSAIKTNAGKFIDMVRRRNEVLIHHPVKLAAVIKIFSMNQVNTICFNESTDFADLIADKLNEQFGKPKPIAIVYHSNITSRTMTNPNTGEIITTKAGSPKVLGKTTLRNMAIQGLTDGTYKFLCTAKALDEGISIPSLRQVITTAGTTNPIQYKQRSGRGKTVDIYDEDKITNIFNLCFNDFTNEDGKVVLSRDLQKLRLRQSQSDIVPIEVSGLDQLNSLLTT